MDDSVDAPQPSRRRALKTLAAGGALGWVAPMLISAPAASAASTGGTMANFIQANLTTSGMPLFFGQNVPFTTTQVQSGITVDGTGEQFTIPVTGTYLVSYGFVIADNIGVQFDLQVNGVTTGLGFNNSSTSNVSVDADATGESTNLVSLTAGDVVTVECTTPFVVFVDVAWIIIVQIA